jgi:tetratricopeptide (TPR) repeat protein
VLFTAYVRTAAPDILSGDSGELVTAAVGLGVPHPTGYPVDMLLAHAAQRLSPLGSIAYRVALLNALVVAAAAVALLLLLRSLRVPRPWALLVSLALGFGALAWSQAVAQEVYGLNLLLLLTAWLLLLGPQPTPSTRRICFIGLLLGVACAHHGTALLTLPATAYLVWHAWRSDRRDARRWIHAPFWFLLGYSAVIYLPLRAAGAPYVNWGRINDLNSFLAHLSGRQFHGIMGRFSWPRLAARLRLAGSLAQTQLGWALLPTVLLCVARAVRRHDHRTRFLLLVLLVNLAFTLTYSIPDIEPFFLPDAAAVAVLWGMGLRDLPAPSRRPTRTLFTLTALGAALLAVGGYWPADRSRNFVARDYAASMLRTTAPHSIVSTFGWTAPFAMMTLIGVEHWRDDLLVDTPLLPQERDPEPRTHYRTIWPAELQRASDRVLPEGLLFRILRADETWNPPPNLWSRIFIRGGDDPTVFKTSLDRALLADAACKRAIFLETEGRDRESRAALAKAFQLGHDNAHLINNLGSVHFRAGRLEEALTMFRLAPLRSPEFDDALLNQGSTLLAMGRPREALKPLKEYLARGYDLPITNFQLGDAYAALGRLDDAIQCYQHAARLAPEDPTAHLRIGYAALQAGQLQLAEMELLLAQTLDPLSIPVQQTLASLEQTRGNLQRAEEHLRKALQLDPQDTSTLNNLANVLIRRQRLDEARELLERAIAIRPLPLYRNNLAGLLLQEDKAHEALPILESILQEYPEFEAARYNLELARKRLQLE